MSYSPTWIANGRMLEFKGSSRKQCPKLKLIYKQVVSLLDADLIRPVQKLQCTTSVMEQTKKTNSTKE